jgi:heme-degrading monooxygenase HmoA
MKKLVLLSVFVILLALSSTTRGNDRMKKGAIRTQKEYTMEMVLIDTFIVPEESKADFLERTQKAQSFIRTLPGFVEGFLYEKKEGESKFNFMTIAVWKNEDAFENAKKAVATEFQKKGFDPQETRKRLRIESERAVYQRCPY